MSQTERAIIKKLYEMLPSATSSSKVDLMRVIRMIESGSYLR